MQIRHPYLLFIGDAPDPLSAKTADGVARWRREWCVGQLRLPGCKADLGIPDADVPAAAAAGAKTLIVGVANRGGKFSPTWIETMLQALDHGMDIASGLHNKVADIPEVAAKAKALGRSIFDVRHPDREFEIGTGARRPGRRLLTVGTDCSIGKMFTALALEKEMRAQGLDADFRATGQTGILIAGSGVSVDAVVADFISGATEWLAPANDPDHWDAIEGQGSLFHASYAGVSLGLLHGAQADALVMCHEPTRTHMRGLPHYPLPPLADCIRLNEQLARLTNPAAKCVAVSVNTSALDRQAADRFLKETEDRLGLPAVDPLRTGVGKIVDRLQA